MPITISHRLVTALLRPVALTLCLPLAMAALINTSHAQPLLPQRGMSQQAVEQQFGAPEDTRPPVGQPPIERWVYADFTVYFEGHYTLHAVSHHAPAAISAPAIESGVSQEAEPAATRPAFRFNPATGQITEVDDVTGAPVTSSTETAGAAQASLAQAQEHPVQESPAQASTAGSHTAAPAPTEPETAPATAETSPEAEPIAPTAATAAQSEPAAEAVEAAEEEEAPRFRFDPVSGRIILDGAPVDSTTPAGASDAASPTNSDAANSPANGPADSAVNNTAEPGAPTPEAAAEQGGYRMQW